MRTRDKLLLVGAASILLIVAATPGAASPQDDQPTRAALPSDRDVAEAFAQIQAQRPFVDAASRIQDSVDAGASEGFAGIVLDDDHITVWWKGPLPAAVRDTIDEVERTTSVDVELAAAAHSRAELVAAADRIAAQIRANPAGPYHSTEIAYNGSGLVVGADEKAARTLPPAMRQAAAGIPVSVRVGAPPQATGRLNDTDPYYGGGRINNNDNGAYCTAGWPVEDAYGEYMLTAGHCGRPGGTWNNGNDTRYFGIGIDEHVDHDLLLIDASVAGRMWDGFGAGEFTKTVIGSDHAFPNEWVCTSGSVGGAWCWFQVSGTFQYSYCDYDVYGRYECWYDLVLARWQRAEPAPIWEGDSGGPVFVPTGPNQSQVVAKGVINGTRPGDTRYLVFQDFITAQRDFGISVVRG